MNRLQFLKGTMASGFAALASGAKALPTMENPPKYAKGSVKLDTLAGEPLLAAPSANSVAISWAVSRTSTGWVEIADNPTLANVRRVKCGTMPMAQLSSISLMARVDGLKPSTRYWYRIVTEEITSAHFSLAAIISRGEQAVSKIYSFVTPGEKAESRFGVINDTHAQWDSFAFVAKKFRAMKFPIGVWAGDALNCTENQATAVESFLVPEVPTKNYASETPFLFVPGNHEFGGEYAMRIDEVMPCRAAGEHEGRFAALKWNFAVRQGDIALIGMDTGDGLHDDDTRLCGLASFSEYRRLQTEWLEKALRRPEIASAPYAVMICHIPLYNSGPNPNGCEKPLKRGCASWVRECQEQWGPILDRYGVQLVICGHEHSYRWDDQIPGYHWSQVVGGGPECGYGAGYKPQPEACPTIIEGVVKSGKLKITVYDAWRDNVLSMREFSPRNVNSI